MLYNTKQYEILLKNFRVYFAKVIVYNTFLRTETVKEGVMDT